MALSSDRRASSAKKRDGGTPKQSLAANQSAADEIEKLLNGFCVDEGGMDLPAGTMPQPPEIPAPLPGIPVASEAASPAVETEPGGAAATAGPLSDSAFADLPPAVTGDDPRPPAQPRPGLSSTGAAGSQEPPVESDAFSLDDFVLPEDEAAPTPPAPVVPPSLPEAPPPLPSEEPVAPEDPPALPVDDSPPEARRPDKKGKRRRGGKKGKPRGYGDKPSGGHSTALAVLIVLLVVAVYGCLFYGDELFPRAKEAVETVVPKSTSVKSVVGKVKETLEKVAPEADGQAEARRDPVPRSVAPAVPVSKPLPVVEPPSSGPSGKVAAEGAAVASKKPAVAKKPPERPAPRPKPVVAGRLEGIEIVPTNTVFVEWPDIMVTAILGRGDEGGAIINDELVSIGEPCAAGPILRAVAPQKATFEWNGDRRDYFINTKSWGKIQPKGKR